jgi:large subunit ribosomal protein L9
MKVILLKDVPKLGKKDAIKDVPQGHALNFLIPRKLAIAATPSAVAQMERRQQEQDVHARVAKELIKETFNGLHDTVVTINERANAQGHLFSKITADHVMLAVKQSCNTTIDSSWVTFDKPIKSVGDHAVCIKQGDVKAVITLRVVGA